MKKRKKKQTPTGNEHVKELEVELEKYYKGMKAATIVNLELRSLFEEFRKREKMASCIKLRDMLDKSRMLRDNVEWEDKPEWDLINYVHSTLLEEFKKRCRQMWIKYTGEIAPRYVRELEESLEWNKIKPRARGYRLQILHCETTAH